MAEKNDARWHFQTFTRNHGRTYINTFTTEWDHLKKRSHVSKSIYAGRLHPDGTLKFSKGFIEKFPQYSQGQWYWGADRKPVTADQYVRDFPAKPGSAPKVQEEDTGEPVMRRVGGGYAAWQTAVRAGMLGDLQAELGSEMGRGYLQAAVFAVNSKKSMSCLGAWLEGNWLPDAGPQASQRISELLGRISWKQVSGYFKRRHEAKRKAHAEKNPGEPLQYALDNTSISTYSETIEEAEFGHAKRDPQLRQVNLTLVCDQDDSEIVYAHEYSGAINDVTEFAEILSCLVDAGFDLADTVLVTDRGYDSLRNVRDMVGRKMLFVQGVRISSKEVRRQIDRYREEIKLDRNYDPALDIHGLVVEDAAEQWEGKPVYLHLYFDPVSLNDSHRFYAAGADGVAKYRNEGTKPPAIEWQIHGSFVRQDADGTWSRNNESIDRTLRYRGFTAIRSNFFRNPFEAKRCYNRREMVERDFRIFKNDVGGDRIRGTKATYIGRLFVFILATSLRMMMLHQAKANETPDNKIPENSLDDVLEYLDHLYAEKRGDANAWVVRTPTKKQRNMFALLGVDPPPKVLY